MAHRNNKSNYAAQRGPSLPPTSNRISGATKYYFVGLGNAIPFTPGAKNCRDESCSKDREPPEFEKNRLNIGYNPFLLDLFLLGNMLRRQLLDVSNTLFCRQFLVFITIFFVSNTLMLTSFTGLFDT